MYYIIIYIIIITLAAKCRWKDMVIILCVCTRKYLDEIKTIGGYYINWLLYIITIYIYIHTLASFDIHFGKQSCGVFYIHVVLITDDYK